MIDPDTAYQLTDDDWSSWFPNLTKTCPVPTGDLVHLFMIYSDVSQEDGFHEEIFLVDEEVELHWHLLQGPGLSGSAYRFIKSEGYMVLENLLSDISDDPDSVSLIED
jgi:hypothetical protein